MRFQETIGTLTLSSTTSVALVGRSVLKFGGLYKILNSPSLSTATTGIGGLDTGAVAASTLYYVYAVSNGATEGIVASTSDSSPSGFIRYFKVGLFFTNSSSQVSSVHAEMPSLIAVMKDEKPNGTNGGSASTGFAARILNTLQDPYSIIKNPTSFTGSGGSNTQFILNSGSYFITATAPANRAPAASTTAKMRLRNVTDTSDTVLGMSQCTGGGTFAEQFSTLTLFGFFTINSQKTFEIQQRHSNAGDTLQLGFPASSGVNEVYLQVQITKIN